MDTGAPSRLSGLGRFLAAHEGCGAGFDVEPLMAGPGRVTVTCRGCGVSLDYGLDAEPRGQEAALAPQAQPEPEPEPWPVDPVEPLPPSYTEPSYAEWPYAKPPPVATPSADTIPEPVEPAPSSAPPPVDESLSERASVAAPPPTTEFEAPTTEFEAPTTDFEPPPDSRAGKPGAIRRAWRSRWVTVALLLLAAAALAFAIARVTGDEENGGREASVAGAEAQDGGGPEPATEPPQPSAATGSEDGTNEPAREGEANAGDSGQTGKDTEPSAGGELQTIEGATFTLEAPRSWTRRTQGDAFLVEPESGGARVEVYHETNSGLTLDQMAALTSELLAERHPGASISEARQAGDGELRLSARYEGGEETATVIASGEIRYLILRAVDDEAPEERVREADAVVGSFRAG